MAKKTEVAESKKLKLNIKDRLTMSSILPKEGSIISMTVTKDVMDKVKLSQAEMTKVGLKNSPTGLSWDDKADKGKTIEFTSAELEVMRGQITLLDNQKKITLELLPLCEKIRN